MLVKYKTQFGFKRNYRLFKLINNFILANNDETIDN